MTNPGELLRCSDESGCELCKDINALLLKILHEHDTLVQQDLSALKQKYRLAVENLHTQLADKYEQLFRDLNAKKPGLQVTFPRRDNKVRDQLAESEAKNLELVYQVTDLKEKLLKKEVERKEALEKEAKWKAEVDVLKAAFDRIMMPAEEQSLEDEVNKLQAEYDQLRLDAQQWDDETDNVENGEDDGAVDPGAVEESSSDCADNVNGTAVEHA